MILKNIDALYERMHVKFWIRQILIGLDLPTWSLSTSNAQKGEEIWNNRNSWEKIKDEFALPCSFFIVNPFWTGLRIFKQEFRTLRESKRVSWKGDSKSLIVYKSYDYLFLLKVSLFQNVLWVSSFWPKNQQNFFKNFGPSL